MKPRYEFDARATYLIAGGLGGIGRTIARWLASRGAKSLILLSRSITHSDAVVALLTELRTNSVLVATPICDVGDSNSLKDAIEECRHMAPIKGCIQASMVLKVSKDSTLSRMAC